jgi:hypothetical protein
MSQRSVRRLRVRTLARSGKLPNQPANVPTDPQRIPSAGHRKRGHICGECFGPRSGMYGRLFCNACMDTLFGPMGYYGYDGFMKSMAARKTREAKRRQQRD